jgi:hypothetical protein
VPTQTTQLQQQLATDEIVVTVTLVDRKVTEVTGSNLGPGPNNLGFAIFGLTELISTVSPLFL